MSDYYNDSVFGYTSDGTMPADMLNPDAADGMDWGAVLTAGIRGAAQGAISARVQGAYQSGQLQQQIIARQRQNQQFVLILIVGAVVYMASKG